MTRQRIRQIHLNSIGQCDTGCGRPLASATKCYHCLCKIRSRQRKRKGYKAQYDSGKGRPRITITPKSELQAA